METSPRGRSAFLTTAGVLAALALVAVAARGSTSTGDGRGSTSGNALADVLFTLYLLAIAGGAIVFVYLLVLRRRARAQTGKAPQRSLAEMLATMLVLVAFALLAARRLADWERQGPRNVEEDLIGRGGTIERRPPETVTDAAEAEFAWIPALATVGLVLLGAGAWWLSGRERRRARGELRPRLAAAVARAVDESLDDLRAEPDPRRAVIAAYARLERVLAAHELPRRPAEAPLEYLSRMLAELDVGDRPARALTELFERAKFSQHAVGPEMKEEAIAALETVRDELLAARALAERERLAALQARRGQAAAP